jgi:hypothetical protein
MKIPVYRSIVRDRVGGTHITVSDPFVIVTETLRGLENIVQRKFAEG